MAKRSRHGAGLDDDGCACFSHLVRFLIWASRNAQERERPSTEPPQVIAVDRVQCS